MPGDDNDVWVIRLSANQAFGKQAMATTPLDTINTRRKHSGYNDIGVSTGPRGIGHLFWLQSTTYAWRDVCWSSFQRTLSGGVWWCFTTTLAMLSKCDSMRVLPIPTTIQPLLIPLNGFCEWNKELCKRGCWGNKDMRCWGSLSFVELSGYTRRYSPRRLQRC